MIELGSSMDSPEFVEWLAYYKLQDPETFEKLRSDTMIEDSRKSSLEEISDNVFNIFSQLGLKNGSKQ